MHDMKMLDIFRIPVYSFKFKEHDNFKQSWSEYIEEYDYDRHKKLRKKRFDITNPNLHKEKLFNPIRVFFLECMYEAMSDLTFTHDIGITSCWAVKQGHNGYHHVHTHGNSLFGAVYYLDSDAEKPSGTIFQNVMGDFMSIRMGRHSNKPNFTTTFNHEHHEPWEEGKLVIFPGWLRHTTKTNMGETRKIIGFNTMPIGKTVIDPYDRYDYEDFRDSEMFGDNL
jgi:uncharacterized protein (TIGR02466 family)